MTTAYEPPWEWVDGDPVRSGQFALITGVFLGAASILAAYLLYTSAVLFSGAGAPPTGFFGSLLASPLIVWLVLGPELLFLYLFPRRLPVIGRLGISPIGLQISLPIRAFTVGWGQLSRVGPDWIDVAPSLGTQRYRLTPRQAERLQQFLYRPGPGLL